MAGFFTNLFDELGERRRRLRKSLGDRGQALASFAILAGLMLGSLGLYLRPWMIDVAAWGFAVPVVFLVGYLLIEWRRQIAVQQYKARLPALNAEMDAQELASLRQAMREDPDFDPEDVVEVEERFRADAQRRASERMDQANATVAASGYDWTARLFAFACALAGAAAFVIAFTSEPPAPQIEEWTPPDSAVSVDISP